MSWSVVAAIAGIVAAIVSIVSLVVNRKQLRIAQEEAELHPKLVISLRTMVYHLRPETPGSLHEQASIVFDVTNDGKSAAHNVHCEVRLNEQHLMLDDMHGQNRDFFSAHLGPSTTQPHQVNVGVLSYGSTEARYNCVCDEVGKSEGSVEFEIPEREQSGHQ